MVFPAGTVPFMADNDYYETPERVTQAYEMLEKTGLLAKLEMIKPRRAGDIATCYSDATKAKVELGWEAKRTLDEM